MCVNEMNKNGEITSLSSPTMQKTLKRYQKLDKIKQKAMKQFQAIKEMKKQEEEKQTKWKQTKNGIQAMQWTKEWKLEQDTIGNTVQEHGLKKR